MSLFGGRDSEPLKTSVKGIPSRDAAAVGGFIINGCQGQPPLVPLNNITLPRQPHYQKNADYVRTFIIARKATPGLRAGRPCQPIYKLLNILKIKENEHY
jgi:hypothetical protein